jgi:hypothetical protein
MFTDKDLDNNNKNNNFGGFPNPICPKIKPDFFEPTFKPYYPTSNLFQPKLDIENPDWTPDFSERFDVVGDSINLALHTLGIGKAEYNSLDILSLKSQRRIDCSCKQLWALNILIYYKKNTQSKILNSSPVESLDFKYNKFNLDEF